MPQFTKNRLATFTDAEPPPVAREGEIMPLVNANEELMGKSTEEELKKWWKKEIEKTGEPIPPTAGSC